ncbi:M28 family peptidase [Cesiribacter sp. SM1]|uniref:M28 family peptidase n=1 Tax=Cesiribacter sp. SM1 TaxID=2861196 RepID=UPI001CD528F1|nr:M28 family peptidase [Cesiribacter sp. SM1]
MAFTVLLTGSISLQAQQTDALAKIRSQVEQPEVEMHVRFLAADELEGRDVGSPGIEIAAQYLASYFRSRNLKSLPDAENYRQRVPFLQAKPPLQGELKIGKQSFTLSQDFVVRQGQNGSLQGSAVVLDWGTGAEVTADQVRGKWVIAKAGTEAGASPQAQLTASADKLKKLQELGALGLVELFHNQQRSWNQLAPYLSGSKFILGSSNAATPSTFPLIWLNDTNHSLHQSLKSQKRPQLSFSISGKEEQVLSSSNILAVVEGTDPELKQEYVMLSAHYDHVGIGSAVNGDSIYNGARDNAVGVTALLMAADYFSKNPPKRSVLLAAWTAEEKGLLGSRWFAEHPPVPLSQIIFNLNIDGAGYNDTTKVTVIGLERTEAEADLQAAAQAFGLEAIQDPVPQQNLFDRSDNVHFARAGIPAPTYSMGMTAFDAALMQYYHQPADEAESINFSYVSRYIQSFILAAEKIAGAAQAPFWRGGDKYEAAGNTLYNRK